MGELARGRRRVSEGRGGRVEIEMILVETRPGRGGVDGGFVGGGDGGWGVEGGGMDGDWD